MLVWLLHIYHHAAVAKGEGAKSSRLYSFSGNHSVITSFFCRHNSCRDQSACHRMSFSDSARLGLLERARRYVALLTTLRNLRQNLRQLLITRCHILEQIGIKNKNLKNKNNKCDKMNDVPWVRTWIVSWSISIFKFKYSLDPCGRKNKVINNCCWNVEIEPWKRGMIKSMM